MLSPTPPQYRRRTRHRSGPAPALVRLAVKNSGLGRFGWFFDRPFDDSGVAGWTAADFAALRVDGNLTLLYPFAAGTT